MDLEVKVAAGPGGVAGFAHLSDPLPLQHPLPPADPRRPQEVGIEVAAPLAFAVDQQVVAVEDRVESPAQNPAVANRDQLRAAGGGDVEAFVDAAAVARCVVDPDRPARSVRALDREDVAEVGDAAVGDRGLGRDRCGKRREGGED